MSPERQLPSPPPPATDDRANPSRRTSVRLEVAVALVGFAALCVLVLTKASQYLEPDDYAYRASIIALSHGQVLLTTAQYHALARQLGEARTGIPQWDHLADGKWISQKNPGYPFFAVVFELLGILRAAPLFYGAVACVGLFAGARRWLGRWGGTWAVLLYCTSGAAITFAWRPTMPSFTDASLIAAGAGALLWAMLATDAAARRRLLAGLFAFVAFEGATFIRYTDVFELGVATVAVAALARRAHLPRRTVGWWLSSVVVFAIGLCTFDGLVYGSPFTTGYETGNISFSVSALPGNLGHMPLRLLEVEPMVVLAIVALGWIVVRLVRGRRARRAGRPSPARVEHQRDGVVAAVLLVGWCAIWGLYFAYTWTLHQNGGDPVHVVRFYLPTLGLTALLGAWTLARVPRVTAFPSVALALVFGVLSFHVMAAGGGPGGPGGLPGGPSGAGRTGAPSGSKPGALPGATGAAPSGAGKKAGAPPRGARGGGPPGGPGGGATGGPGGGAPPSA